MSLDNQAETKKHHKTPMKTTSHTSERRARHHAALASLTANPFQSGLAIWRKLRRVECLASAGAVAYCNGEIFAASNGSKAGGIYRHYDFQREGCEAWEAFVTREIIPAVARAFGGRIPDGFCVNGDPRGYALKIDKDQGGIIPAGMETDWGGCGILAPEIH